MKTDTSTARTSLPQPVRIALRWVVMLAVFTATLVGAFQLSMAAMDRLAISRTFPPLYAGIITETQILNLPPRSHRSPLRIGFLGDSTVQGYPEGLDVATQLGLALEEKLSSDVEVISLAQVGMASLEYYSLAEVIADSNADILVISFNVASLSPQSRDFWARRSLAGWIPPSRISEAISMPLPWWNITFDRLLFYIATVQSNLEIEWFTYRSIQLRSGNAIKMLRRRLQGIEADWASSLPNLPWRGHATKADRFSRPYVLQNLGDAADGASVDHPVFQMLGGAIDIFRARGIEVLVYATPTNVEHMERVGIDTRAGMKTTIENLELLAKAHGAHFLDLHRMFPDPAFRDPGNHLTYEGEHLGPQQLGQRVAEWFALQSVLSRRSGRND